MDRNDQMKIDPREHREMSAVGAENQIANSNGNFLERAKSLTGMKETAALVRQALETLVRVESGKRLIALDGSISDTEAAAQEVRAVVCTSEHMPH